MKHLLLLTIIFYTFLSCKTKTKKAFTVNNIQLLIPDTTNNERAKTDLERIEHCSQISKQLGLENLEKGVDSFEIRLWLYFSFSNSEELFVIKLLDTTCRISFYRVYLRGFDYDNINRNREWNHFTEPIVDSSISKTVLIHKDDLKSLVLQDV